jgi:hypothetical protein
LKMKKALTLLFLVFLVVPASAQRKKVVKSFLPQVTSPAAERAGIAFQGTPFQILNSTPFFCQLVAGGKDLGVVGPGDLVFDQRHLHNLWSQMIPVAALCYRDNAMTQYVGAAGRVFAFSEYAPAEWVIRPSDIRTLDGRIPASAPTASTATTPHPRKIELPRETLSTVGIQVVNNTTEDVQVFLNGVRRGTVSTGGLYYAPVNIVGNFSRPLIITITGAGCTYTEQVWVQRNVQWARQIVFGPEYCGWSRWR